MSGILRFWHLQNQTWSSLYNPVHSTKHYNNQYANNKHVAFKAQNACGRSFSPYRLYCIKRVSNCGGSTSKVVKSWDSCANSFKWVAMTSTKSMFTQKQTKHLHCSVLKHEYSVLVIDKPPHSNQHSFACHNVVHTKVQVGISSVQPARYNKTTLSSLPFLHDTVSLRCWAETAIFPHQLLI